ncbi:hypothetical protein QBC40DRAFT_292388 [Triangularia verruculosa]|uniref:Uncharacterized protein n=1 Tax=Triangularia verruculosa TaxID=2587418 RepID=A0AAN6XQB9_9PEZI|nr:hypothetical protein QBC40DRAFT_292388 [Triangularia verruculosa]
MTKDTHNTATDKTLIFEVGSERFALPPSLVPPGPFSKATVDGIAGRFPDVGPDIFNVLIDALYHKHDEVFNFFGRSNMLQTYSVVNLAAKLHWLAVLGSYIQDTLATIHNSYAIMSEVNLAAAACIANHFGDKDTLVLLIDQLAIRSRLNKEGTLATTTVEECLYWSDGDSLTSLLDNHTSISLSVRCPRYSLTSLPPASFHSASLRLPPPPSASLRLPPPPSASLLPSRSCTAQLRSWNPCCHSTTAAFRSGLS